MTSPDAANRLMRSNRRAAVAWLHSHLFNSHINTVLTLVTVTGLFFVLRSLLLWAFTEAQWGVVPANFRLLMVGTYPIGEMWRIWLGVVGFSLVTGFQWGRARRTRLWVLTTFVVAAAVVLLIIHTGTIAGTFGPIAVAAIYLGYLVGWFARPSNVLLVLIWASFFLGFIILLGADLGAGGVSSTLWGGLLLTLLISIVAILASFPLGIVLAIMRTSKLPIVSMLATIYIELIRGVPLLVVLFIAQLFVPLFFPSFFVPKILRAMIGISLFQAAYIAENVRGGLQAVGKGQTEAARGLGLNSFQTLWLIVLPQALRVVIPANVGQFIQLFKETSLVSVVGLTDLLGIGNVIVANPNWSGLYKEIFLTIALIYGFFSYAMSSASYALERRLKTD